ncbi:MAG: alanine racemase [Lachnospiraceae bacterium]|nr:alanine racemase [Lachnospiraceae bacterium]
MDVREWEFQRGYVEVNLDYIVENLQNMKAHIAPETRILAVIKTDGYGHGGIAIAKCIEGLDYLFGFAVATAEEAFELREAGITKPILVLSYTFPYAYSRFVKEDIRVTVFREDTLENLSKAALEAGKTARVHIKVDTGMGRIGIMPDEKGISFVKKALNTPGIEIEGIYTHFACADETDKTSARKQIKTYQSFVDETEQVIGCKIPIHHCSNSAGILELPEANMDLVRAGITLYGLMPSSEVETGRIALQPALSLHSHIVYIKTIHKGQTVSYGSKFIATKDTRVATIPLGYGDGYPRSLSSKGYVLICGQKAPILGRVCMDQFMVDVTEIAQAKEGDLVTLIGRNGEECITADYLGELSGRFNYELVCDLNQRLPRVYIKDNNVLK